MYIEKNGYVIMHKEDMNFYSEDCETTEVIEEAKVYVERADAEKDLNSLNEEYTNTFEIVNFHQTTWLDKVDLYDQSTFDKIDDILNIKEELENE